jgi:transposase
VVAREVRFWMKEKVREGVPIARVAREYGVSRQTVYNVLAAASAPARERKSRGSKLDPFKSHIEGRLSRFDLPATTLFDEVRQRGYSGQLTTVKDFVRDVKATAVKEVIARFETEPGVQAQVDWGECGTVVEGGERKKLYVFVFVLGFSRMLFARFTTSTRQPLLLACLREAFERLGVPRELVLDNMKTAVDRHVLGEEVRFNRAFLDFCEHYGARPVACPPYWPRAKGKVESAVQYLKGSFLTGRSFTDLADLNEQLATWLDRVANTRVHGTTKERPIDRFAIEQATLRPAAASPVFDTRELLIRRVHSDSHVRVNGVAYSVPPHLAGRSVHVRVQQLAPTQPFEVLHAGAVVASHQIAALGPVTLPEHARAIREHTRHRPATAPKARYEQLPAPATLGLPLVPLVQTPSLSHYERLAEAS